MVSEKTVWLYWWDSKLGGTLAERPTLTFGTYRHCRISRDQARGRLGRNRRPRGRNFALNGTQGEVGVSLKKKQKKNYLPTPPPHHHHHKKTNKYYISQNLSSVVDWSCDHTFRDQARGQLGRNSRPRGRNFALNGTQGEVEVSLKKKKKKKKKIFFFRETHFHSVTSQKQAVVPLLDNQLPLHRVSPSIKWQ